MNRQVSQTYDMIQIEINHVEVDNRRDSIMLAFNWLFLNYSINLFRRPFRRSTTYDIPSEDNLPNENKCIPSKIPSVNKIRNNNSRRLSLVKFELPPMNSNATKGLKRFLFSLFFIYLFIKMNKNHQIHLVVLILFKNYYFDNLVRKHDLIYGGFR